MGDVLNMEIISDEEKELYLLFCLRLLLTGFQGLKNKDPRECWNASMQKPRTLDLVGKSDLLFKQPTELR